MSILDDQIFWLQSTCKRLGLHENVFRFLSKPIRTVIVNFPVKMDNGHIEMFQGYRVLHSTILGPGKGGLMFCPNCDLDTIKALAMVMSWKNGVIGLPLGGAKGGVRVDYSRLSLGEKERLTRRYTSAILNVIGPNQDIPSPDLNTGEREMAWVMDTYSMGMGKTTPGVCTGKPTEIGGTKGRDKAVGWGLGYILRAFAEHEKESFKDQKIIIQGLGHVGLSIAAFASQFGAKIVGISDHITGLYNPDGLDISAIINHKQTLGSLGSYEKAEHISQDALFEQPCDALVPCALPGQITKKIAEKVQCRAVLEGANAPTTMDADQILDERKITVIPDILANAGGLIVSYFEWVQDLSALSWSISKIQTELERIILGAYYPVAQLHENEKVTYRQAAYMVAIKKIAAALQYRGIYP
jgi:glutamate dehydrogenase (NAD(P)+)